MQIISSDLIQVGSKLVIIKNARNDQSWVGHVVEVKRIVLPFIFVEDMTPNNYWEGEKHRFDINNFIFAELTPEYLEAQRWLHEETEE